MPPLQILSSLDLKPKEQHKDLKSNTKSHKSRIALSKLTQAINKNKANKETLQGSIEVKLTGSKI